MKSEYGCAFDIIPGYWRIVFCWAAPARKKQNMYIFHCKSHGWWCLGDTRSQCIGRYDIDWVFPESSVPHMEMIEATNMPYKRHHIWLMTFTLQFLFIICGKNYLMCQQDYPRETFSIIMAHFNDNVISITLQLTNNAMKVILIPILGHINYIIIIYQTQ